MLRDADLDVIVVTAQRRPQAAEEVPISLTAIEGDELERVGVTDIAALGKVVPSLTMTRTGAFTQPYLRGVGKRSTLGVENGVATYVDGVYLASSISTLQDLQGIERVEVLNGPQGTLFGRNTTAGVIQVVTRDPSPEASGEWRVQAGTYGYLRGDLFLTGGNERIAGNLAASLFRNDGYGTNLFTGKSDQGEIEHGFVGRAKLVVRPDAAVKLTFAADYQDIDQDFAIRPVAGFPPIGNPRVLGFRDGDQDASNRFRLRYGGVSIRADAELENFNFMSLSALRRTRARFGFDLDLGPANLLSGAPTVEEKQFSQEFQLQSISTSPISWVTGLYFIRTDERYEPTLFGYGGSYSAALGGRTRQTLRDRGISSSYAAYAQGDLPVGELTKFTLGFRYTFERRSIRANGERIFDNPPFIRPIPGLPLLNEQPLRSSEDFRQLTWRVSLDRQLSDRVMGYVLFSRGFQSGGWNLQTPQNPVFQPERINDYEAGLKYVSPGRQVRADANIFYYDYRNLQVNTATPIGSATTNATSAELFGAELQLQARLGRSTQIDVGGQFLSAKYNRFPNATCTDFSPGAASPYTPIACDVSGNRLPFAPELKLQTRGTHGIRLGEDSELDLSLIIASNSGYFSEPDNVVRQKSFATIDTLAHWRPDRRGRSFRFWISNLTNARYYNNLVTFPTAGVLQSPAAPRRIGASVTSSF